MATSLTMYYGSQTGNAELVAMDAADAIEASGVSVELASLDEVTPEDLDGVETLILVTSTYDDGDLPDTAQEFFDGLASVDLSGLSYTVLALGDSSYDDFCAAGRQFDERLTEQGAQAFWPRVECDIDYEPGVKAWTERFLARLAGDDMEAPAAEEAESVHSGTRHSRQSPYMATVSASRTLSGPESDKSVHHVELKVDPARFAVAAGDSVGVLVRNGEALVAEALTVLGLDGDTAAEGYPGTWRDALTDAIELRLPSRDLIALVGQNAHDVNDEWLYGKDVVDLAALVIETAGSEAVVATLRPLQHREYSVASSPVVDATTVALMISRVEYEAAGRTHRGAGSHHVTERLAVGDELGIFDVPTTSFRLPTGETDIVMVGPGTGVAPFRAFLQERAATGATGRNWLVFGDRREASDFSYRDELEEWREYGTLTRLDVAFSRDQAEKVYVQDRLREHGKELFAWLSDGAVFYVCGDLAAMAPAVDQALVDVVAEHGAMDQAAARTWVDDLRRQRRYLKDVY